MEFMPYDAHSHKGQPHIWVVFWKAPGLEKSPHSATKIGKISRAAGRHTVKIRAKAFKVSPSLEFVFCST
jgi:hypothetical protein